jgi:cytochrome b561
MINNVIEIWYWTVMLAVLIAVAIYFSLQFVRGLLAAVREQMNDVRVTAGSGKATEPYSRRMVIAHWLTLMLLLAAWYLGEMLVDARMEKTAPLIGYFAHALLGGAILLLTAMRLIFRSVDGAPPPVNNSLLEMVGRGVHYGLYILLVLLSVSGFMVVLTSSVGVALVTGGAIVLPDEYTGPGAIPHLVHEILVKVGIAAVALHVLGASRHQFIVRDGLMRRMSLRRKENSKTG